MIASIYFELHEALKEKYSNNLNDYLLDSIWGYFWFRLTLMIGTSLLILPLNLLTDIAKLRFSSFLGIFCIIVITIVIIFQLPDYLTYKIPDDLNLFDASSAFTDKFYFFKGASTIFFAYACHYGVFPICQRLENNNPDRIEKVIRFSTILNLVLFFIISSAGYLTQPINTPDMIIKRDSIYKTDRIMSFCRFLLCILLFTKIAANYNSLRVSIFNLVWKTELISLKK